MKSNSFFQTKYSYLLIVLIIFSLVLKFGNFPNAMEWNGDVGRDQLVASVIVENKEVPLVGHYNSGINFYYPPFYYYYLGLVHLINDRLEIVFFLHILFNTLGVVFIYKIGKLISDQNMAIVSSFLYLFSQNMIVAATTPISAYLSLPIFLLAMWIFLKGFYENKNFLVWLSIFVMFLVGSIFYGAMIFIPVMGILILMKEKDRKTTLIQFLLTVLVSYMFFNFPLFMFFGLKKTILSQFGNGVSLSIFNSNLLLIIKKDLLQLVGWRPEKIRVIISTMLLAIIYLGIHKAKSLKNIIIVGILIIYNYFLVSLKSFQLGHYLILLRPLFYLLIGYMISEIIKLRQSISYILGILLFIVFSELLIYPIKSTYFYKDPQNSFLKTKLFYHEIKTIGIDSHTQVWYVRNHTNGLWWDSLSLWYFINRDYHNFKLDNNSFYNLKNTALISKFILICDHGEDAICDKYLFKIDSLFPNNSSLKLESKIGDIYSINLEYYRNPLLSI